MSGLIPKRASRATAPTAIPAIAPAGRDVDPEPDLADVEVTESAEQHLGDGLDLHRVLRQVIHAAGIATLGCSSISIRFAGAVCALRIKYIFVSD